MLNNYLPGVTEHGETPIYNALAFRHGFRCGECWENGWPFYWFACNGCDL